MITPLDQGTVYPGQRVLRTWPLLALYRAGQTAIGLAAGGPYDDDGAALVTFAGLTVAGGRRSGAALTAVNLEMRDGRIFGQLARYSSPDLTTESAGSSLRAAELSSERTTASSALALPNQVGRAWEGIEPLARDGLWVRRKSWTDGTQRLRYEAGPGTVRAVAVMQSAILDTRVVLNAEFGVAEFMAVDWVLADPPTDKEDLTDAVFTIDQRVTSDGGPTGLGYWMLYSNDASVSAPPADPTPSGEAEDPPPADGIYLRVAIAGVAQWVPCETICSLCAHGAGGETGGSGGGGGGE